MTTTRTRPTETSDLASITCPRCGRTSYNPHDIVDNYCGACHWWTSHPILGAADIIARLEAEGSLGEVEDLDALPRLRYFDLIEAICDRIAPSHATRHDVVTFVALALLWIAAWSVWMLATVLL